MTLFFFLFLFVSAFAADVDLLISFKNSLQNPSSISNWSPTESPCSFPGVGCKGGHVASLTLQDPSLSPNFKSVSDYLLSLPSLETLSLSSTNLTGDIQSVLKCSSQLTVLDLSGNNNLRGAVSDVATLVTSCNALQSLNLSSTSIGTYPLKKTALPTQILPLQSLDLSYNKIETTGDLQWILSTLGLLKRLGLSSNKITGQVPSFNNCTSLQYLDLSENNLAGAVPVSTFSNCISLTSLNLSVNHLTGTVPDLSACTSLKTLSLSYNNFSGQIPINDLAAMRQLKILELGFNNFNGSLPESISKLTNLELLDLSSNGFTGPIPEKLCSNGESSLKELYLQNNYFSGFIPDSISECTNLISLDLSLNSLTGSIPGSLGSLSKLKDLIIWQNNLSGNIPSSLSSLKYLENLILDYNGLTGTIPDSLSNCTGLNWISLASNRLNGSIPAWIGKLDGLSILKLSNNSFTGSIPSELGNCKSLVWLDLNSNSLTGSIPVSISKQSGKVAVGQLSGKRYVYLRNDESSLCHGKGSLLEFGGIRSEDLTRMPSKKLCNFTRMYMGNTQATFNNNGSMIFLDLSYNQLTGSIPKEMSIMFYLLILNLGHNLLSGLIPPEIGQLVHVAVLDLSNNLLEGPIPASFSAMSLSEINLSNNRLNGSIPELGSLATFPKYVYENNSGLCGFPLPPCDNSNGSNNDSSHQKSHRQASLAGSVALGLLFALFCIFGLVIIAIESKKRRMKKEENNNNNSNFYLDSRSNSATISNWKLSGTNAMSINLATFDKPLQKLTFADLLEATNGFNNDSLIGSGGFGDVYKAQLKDNKTVAIKKLIHVSGQGDREFTAEMETIGKIKHRNLVPLLGYCKVGEERLLVYEYMKYGSLDDILHDKNKIIKLNWQTRKKIAVGAARGLAFLHHNCIPHIIHRDMKSSNVLLDENFEARVSDFGMARFMSVMDTHLSVSTLAGTPGYVPPEYYQSFRCTTKGDIYSYGVVLLELLTGREPTDSVDFGDDCNLVGWVKQHSKTKIMDVFDKCLVGGGETGIELELLEHLKIACACLDDRPSKRPTMLKVMAMFKEIQMGSEKDGLSEGFSEEMSSLKEGKEEN